ncbi:protein of unknown function [Acidithiobacillus ferrivorans]|uniref:Uncharacterized protein n=1 Tax=Acidithiobacillus ferrivorans TaxID=160808 RepID=A0A060V031_9PROT|nr:hypothetical protein AFERRI_70002 [Acidithiobacillus ferrivorans]SMH66585.1 protein of unknown function [Acidithiobacillus ferrivorans]
MVDTYHMAIETVLSGVPDVVLDPPL